MRQTVTIKGLAFELGDFTVRFGVPTLNHQSKVPVLDVRTRRLCAGTRAALSHPRDVVYRAPFRSSTNHARSSEDSSIVPSWRPSCYRVWVSPSSWCSARRNTKAWRRYRPCTHRITPWCSTWDSFDRMACSSHRDSFIREVPPCCCCRRCRTCRECTIDIISCLLSRYRTHRSPPGHSLSISKPQPTHTHTHTHPPSL